jgi:hypothetical protein
MGRPGLRSISALALILLTPIQPPCSGREGQARNELKTGMPHCAGVIRKRSRSPEGLHDVNVEAWL